MALGSVGCWRCLLLTSPGRACGGGCCPPNLLTLTMFSPALVHSLMYCCELANVALSHAVDCRELDGHSSYSPLGEMAWLEPRGSVFCRSQKGPWKGSSPICVTPWKHQRGGFPKSPLFLRPKHLPFDYQRLFRMLVPCCVLQRSEQRVTSDLLVCLREVAVTRNERSWGLFLA